jgi:hypothetical protein
LSDSPIGFKPPKPFAILGVDFSGKGHNEMYSKVDLRTYLNHNKKKGMSQIEGFTADNASKPCGFPWLKLSVEMLFNYNLQQVTKYLDQLNAMRDEASK